MPNRPTYSLQILLGTIAAFAVAAAAFGARPSAMSGLLVAILGMCGPGLLVIVWRSGAGYRRSFVIGAAAPSVVCAYRLLSPLGHITMMPNSSVTKMFEFTGSLNRAIVLALMAFALGGGLAGMVVHWAMAGRSGDATTRQNGDLP